MTDHPKTRLIICDTCKINNEVDASGKTDGEKLASLIENNAPSNLKVERHSCLMACKRSCSIALEAPDKISYILGEFQPSGDDARSILEYAQKYDSSASGQVPYKEWPERVKGHFIARIPPRR